MDELTTAVKLLAETVVDKVDVVASARSPKKIWASVSTPISPAQQSLLSPQHQRVELAVPSHGVILTFELACYISVTFLHRNLNDCTYTDGQAHTQAFAALPTCNCAFFPIVMRLQHTVLSVLPVLFTEPVWQTDICCETILGKATAWVGPFYRATHGIARVVEDISARRMICVGLYVAIGMATIRMCCST